VVTGHGMLPLIAESNDVYGVYLAIYSFHIAVFVMVSGYFSKSGPPNARQLKRVLIELIIPYIIFETIWTIIRFAVTGWAEFDYTTASWTLWFLLALAMWRIVLPYLVLLRWPLTIAIVISIAAGYSDAIDSTLSAARAFGMLPFFVFGWKLRQWDITGRWLALPAAIAWRWRIAAIVLFAAVTAMALIGIDLWREIGLRRFMLYNESYQAIGWDEPWSGLVRLILLAVALLLTAAFLTLIPRRVVWFTAWGTATMYIYLLHTFPLYPLRESGVLAGWQPGWVFPAMVLYCLGITIVLSLPVVRRVFRPLVEPRVPWLFRREPSTATGTIVLPDDVPPSR
jgi:fucose 4-O-acetylase-like acetyltransferase